MLLFIDFCTCSWIIPWLLPFLLGLGLGWLIWGRLRNRIEELERENANLKAKIVGLESDLAECNAKNAGIDSEMALLKGRIREYESSGGAGALGFVSGNEGGEGDVVAGGIDIDGDGVIDIEGDTAGGGIDIDGDGQDDMTHSGLDVDGDGIAEFGGDVVEGGLDIDGDGVADIEGEALEGGGLDIDGDGKDDMIVGGLDVDGDGIADVGGDVIEGGVDIDGDGRADIAEAGAGAMEAVGASSSGDSGGAAGKSKNIYAALKSDNLQVIEGIGPKMNEILNDNGVADWRALSEKSPSDIRAILDSVNAKRYRIIDPTSWPQQAKLAADGDWEDLIRLQKNLDSGRKAGATGETDSKVEKLLIKMGVLKRWKQDDLTAVEGIGPKISQLLHDAGITTWRALANAEVSRIQSVLDAAGKRFKLADPGSWPKQAEMAADGRWDDLQEYQDFLQGGK